MSTDDGKRVMEQVRQMLAERDERILVLETALRGAKTKFERSLIQNGTDPEYAAIAVKPYDEVLAKGNAR